MSRCTAFSNKQHRAARRAARAAGTKRPRQPAPAGAAFNAATYSVAPIIADARARRRDEI